MNALKKRKKEKKVPVSVLTSSPQSHYDQRCTTSEPYGLCCDHYLGPLWRTVQLVSHTVFAMITILDLSEELYS